MYHKQVQRAKPGGFARPLLTFNPSRGGRLWPPLRPPLVLLPRGDCLFPSHHQTVPQL